jgi:hypothetical protein
VGIPAFFIISIFFFKFIKDGAIALLEQGDGAAIGIEHQDTLSLVEKNETIRNVPMQSAPPQAAFCTNCGNPVSGQSVACMSCGAKPVGHRKFCGQCGVALNSEQVIYIHCGAKIGGGGISQFVGIGGSGSVSGAKSKVAAGVLAIFLGGLGYSRYSGYQYNVCSALLHFDSHFTGAQRCRFDGSYQ